MQELRQRDLFIIYLGKKLQRGDNELAHVSLISNVCLQQILNEKIEKEETKNEKFTRNEKNLGGK